MDFTFGREDLELQARARAFAEGFLFPAEAEVEETNGLSDATRARIKRAVLDHGLNAINHSREDGGQGLSLVQQCLVAEEVGKATNMLGLLAWLPAQPLRLGTPGQKARYLRPACAGEKDEAFLVSEPHAGSDARAITTKAVKRGGRYVIDGIKCFASGSERADYLLVHANVDGDPDKATLFLLDGRPRGYRVLKRPQAMFRSAFTNPWVALEGVEADEDQVLGKVGQGFELTKDWFVEQRANIGARAVGVAIRCAETAAAWARERRAFGRAIQEFQAIEFKLADMAVAIMAAKALVYRCAAEYDRGLDRKQAHARMAVVKLYCTEMAGRVADEAVQILGGHGFMLDSPVARHYQSVRAERIVEGTSEIQRAIIGGEIRKRGLGTYTGLMAG